MVRPNGTNEAGDGDIPGGLGVENDSPKNENVGNGDGDGGHLNQESDEMPRLGEGDCFPSPSPRVESTNQTQPNTSRTARERSRSVSEHYDEAEHLRGRMTSNDEPKPNLIVNYLPQYLSDKDFYNLFAPFGSLESIKIMRDTHTGYSFGYGFVNYVDINDAIDARNELNGLQLGHKRIKVSFARPPSDDIKDTNLFVTGLPSCVTENDLARMFCPFGVIVHLRVLRDKHTMATRGVAFVRYETRSEACSAIQDMNGAIPPGSRDPIRVRLAQDHGKQKAAYLAGYQAALKMKVEGPFVHPENVYGRTGQWNARSSRGRSRPSTAAASANSNASASMSMYWKGFIEAASTVDDSIDLPPSSTDRRPASRR